jgi:hypothetical protein
MPAAWTGMGSISLPRATTHFVPADCNSAPACSQVTQSTGGHTSLGKRASTRPERERRPVTCRYKTRAGLAECEGQQTRAQQHKAGCGQREESVRNKIVITHDTPATLDARPN